MSDEIQQLDVNGISLNDANAAIQALPPSTQTVRIVGGASRDSFALGLSNAARLEIRGDVGDYCLYGVRSAEVEVYGHAGVGFAQAMESGSAILHGSAGDSLGAFSRGGLIAVYGNGARRAGCGLRGGQVFVRGSVGTQAAYGMQGGSLLIGGSAGKDLGAAMVGGVVYVRGDVESLAEHLEETRMKEPDRLRIGLILLKAGVKATGKDFRAFRVIESTSLT